MWDDVALKFSFLHTFDCLLYFSDKTVFRLIVAENNFYAVCAFINTLVGPLGMWQYDFSVLSVDDKVLVYLCLDCRCDAYQTVACTHGYMVSCVDACV